MFCCLLPVTGVGQQNVVIVGGTPVGFASPLVAARAGRSVTLVEYCDHITRSRDVPIKQQQQRLAGQGQILGHAASVAPHPEHNPQSPCMLVGDWVPDDPREIGFASLPRVPSQHAVVSDVRAAKGVNQHNYLAHHGGRFWVMWSDGPGVEDLVGQRVKFATSKDGMVFNRMGYLVGGRHVDYPHVIEHDGHLLVAFAGGKQTVEILRIRIADLDSLSNSVRNRR
jgi:hypothetical protein